MEKLEISPKEYHETLRFDKTQLPNIEKAGFISGSVISMMRDPFKFLTSGDKKQTAPMEWGSMIDCMWLTPQDFDSSYVVTPKNAPSDLRRFRDSKKPSQDTIDSIKWWDDFEKRNKDKIPISQATYEEAKKAIWMLENHKTARLIHENSEKQCCFSGPNVLGLPGRAKGMMDLVPNINFEWENYVVDLKTTHDISDSGIRSTIYGFEYFMKMKLYIEIINEYERTSGSGDGKRDGALMIFQESSAPYRVKMVEIPFHDLEIGADVICRRVRKMSEISFEKPMESIDYSVKTISMANWMRESILSNESVGA